MPDKRICFKDYKSRDDNFYIESLDKKSEQKDHVHDFFQIIYCKHGAFNYHTKNGIFKLLRGDITIIPPGVPHHLNTDDSSAIIYNIAFNEDFLEDPDLKGFLSSLTKDAFKPFFSPMYEDVYLFESAIGKIRIEFNKDRPGKEKVIKNCFDIILFLLLRMYIKNESDIEPLNEKKRRSINHCISYIDTHYDEALTLKDMSKMAAMSTTLFCTLFKDITGISFKEYLNKKKIERAKSHLRNGEEITETAYLCGFKEFTTFYRNFVKQVGVSPREYKNKFTK